MRNNVKVAPALSPLSAIYSAITDTLIHIPFHGGGGAAINFAASLAVVKGYPTKVTLGSTPSPAPLCGSKVKVSGVTPTGYNGYWKVVYSNGADVYLDLDSSALGDWASGGTMSFNVLYERLGNLAAQDLSGTVTGLWADQTNGMVAHSAGTYTARIPTGISAFDLSAFSGFLVIGAKIKISSATPSSEEFLFSIGRSSQTGAYSGSGTIAMSISTGGQLQLYFRPRTVAGSDSGGAGGGTNSFTHSTALGTTTQRNVVFLLDQAQPKIQAYYEQVLADFSVNDVAHALHYLLKMLAAMQRLDAQWLGADEDAEPDAASPAHAPPAGRTDARRRQVRTGGLPATGSDVYATPTAEIFDPATG